MGQSKGRVLSPVTRFLSHPLFCLLGATKTLHTWFSRDVRLMKRRKSSPPEDTATEESTSVRQSLAHVRLSLRPRMVSPEGEGRTRELRLITADASVAALHCV